MTSSPELPVPDAARATLNEVVRRAMLSGCHAPPPGASSMRADVRAIAGPVVAAELRRLAAEYEETARGDVLRARADSLDADPS